MLKGVFREPESAPYIKGVLNLPSLEFSATLDFHIDTGAVLTTLAPIDGDNNRLDYSRVQGPPQELYGFAGHGEVFLEQAQLVFFGDEKVYVYEMTVGVMEKPSEVHDAAWNLPSVLGRDVLNNWQMLYRPTNQTLDITVIYSDNDLSIEDYAALVY